MFLYLFIAEDADKIAKELSKTKSEVSAILHYDDNIIILSC